MTYSELLNHKSWKIKRNEILERDQHVCQNCSNSKLILNCHVGKVKYISQGQMGATLSDERKGVYEILHLGRPSIIYTDKIFVSINYVDSLQQEDLVYFSFLDNLDSNFQDVYVHFIKSKNNNELTYVSGLEVHHNYYVLGKKPWEYDNSVLKTLCHFCHEDFHKNNEVNFYNMDFEKLKTLQNCNRCNGTGKLLQYLHVQNGVCFECMGNRFVNYDIE